uniref:Uncharacterized protein n=1 Tax=Castor canadensis TaxID=51338 RepID=A0A8C0XTT0_CASCN
PETLPTFCYDLGKGAKDVLNKGCGFGIIKIDQRTKSCGGVEFSTLGHLDGGNYFIACVYQIMGLEM